MKLTLPILVTALLGFGGMGCAASFQESGAYQTSYGETNVQYSDSTTVQTQAQGEVVVGDADEYADADPAALTDFRASLDPYGTWVEDPTYGTVWVPSDTVVGTDFVPYVSAGHWTYADDYVWVSDYEWGWAPFHYGRWVYASPRAHWVWIPGRVYAGAWVTWRVGDYGYDYVGWAPMAPSWYWSSGVAIGIAIIPSTPYYFCGRHDLFHGSVSGRILAGPQVATIAGRTRPFVPANPSVGGHDPANPNVGGHSPSNPSVGGGTNGSGSNAKAGRPFGPAPSTLGLADSQVVSAPQSDRGLIRAQQFSRPSSAVAINGARPPSSGVVNGRPQTTTSLPTTSVYSRPSQLPSSSPTNPVVRSTSPLPQPVARPYIPTTTSQTTSQPTFRPSVPTQTTSQPTFRPSVPTQTSQPTFRPSMPTQTSQPTFRPSMPTQTSQPTFRPSMPSGGGGGSSFRPSAPSGGGFGGGSSFRPSAPSGGFGGGGGGARPSFGRGR